VIRADRDSCIAAPEQDPSGHGLAFFAFLQRNVDVVLNQRGKFKFLGQAIQHRSQFHITVRNLKKTPPAAVLER
jgi:hypothetical protein